MTNIPGKPRVSVVIATRNRATYLDSAIRSVLSQTYTDREVILVDDGSRDATPAVVAAFGDSVQYVRQEPLGRSAARNAGIRLAAGEYVAFLDDDDLWHPEKLERQVKVLDSRPDIGLVHTFTSIIDTEGDPNPSETARRLEYHRTGVQAGYTFEGMCKLCIMFLSSVTVRRHCLFDAGLFDPAIDVFEDWDLYLRLVRITRIETIREPLTSYRLHDGNTGELEFVTGRRSVAEKQLDILARHPVGSGEIAARFHLLRHLAEAHYIGGEMRQARRFAMESLRVDALRAMQSRIPRVLALSLIPRPVVSWIRNRESAAA